MSRSLVLLGAVVLAFGCARAPEPPPVVTVTPDAPPPREPDLTNDDPGLDPKIEAALPEPLPVKDEDVLPPTIPDRAGFGPGEFTVPGAVSAFPGRVGATKSKLIRERGANEASERAVALGLGWLARQQKADGGWQFDAGEWKDDRVAATGLALLPFLGAGSTHKNRAGTADRYQKTVAAGLAFLTKAYTFDGVTTATAHALAAIALCEAYGMTKDADLKPFAQAAVDAIQKAQAADGGWSDIPSGKSDIMVVGWQVQALQTARMIKELRVDDKFVDKMIGFLIRAGLLHMPHGGPYKSKPDGATAKPGTAATAVALLCRYSADGWGPGSRGFADGVAGLMRNPPDGKGALRDSLYFHTATQVLAFYDGEDWKTWNEGPKGADGVRKGGMRDWLTNAQVRPTGEFTGSWEPEGEWGQRVGRLGTTALNALTLEVYYRHLPLYKRDGAGGGKILEEK